MGLGFQQAVSPVRVLGSEWGKMNLPGQQTNPTFAGAVAKLLRGAYYDVGERQFRNSCKVFASLQTHQASVVLIFPILNKISLSVQTALMIV